eukprot:11637954-Karenia_brevis.AAC.1
MCDPSLCDTCNCYLFWQDIAKPPDSIPPVTYWEPRVKVWKTSIPYDSIPDSSRPLCRPTSQPVLNITRAKQSYHTIGFTVALRTPGRASDNV